MVGNVPEQLSEGLREMMIGIGTRNVARVVASYQTLGVLLPSADLNLLERAGAQVNRQIFHLEGAVNRLTGSIMFAAFLFGGVVLYQGGDIRLGYLFWAFSGITLMWMLFFARGHSPWR